MTTDTPVPAESSAEIQTEGTALPNESDVTPPKNVDVEETQDMTALETELFGNDCGEEAVDTSETKQAPVDVELLRMLIAGIVYEGCDLDSLSLKQVFSELGNKLEVDATTFGPEFREQVKELVTTRVQELTDAAAQAAEETESKGKKNRRRSRADDGNDDTETPTKHSKRSRRSVGDEENIPSKPLSVNVAGTSLLAQPRQTASGKSGYYVSGKVTTEIDGQQVELYCSFQCAVIGSTATVDPEEQ